ncbi:mobilization protein C [Azospirillum brasilense]|uniref:mobilization protein C n=1 Tax=Azospirillum brasilense TaxID=192 RepID=UPI00190DF83E|nr:mobilization protein C [Azospirillum brasilense]MBK3735240.1 mobilization protein C [Azospirillum brasilense]
MARTLDQRIAETETRLSRLRAERTGEARRLDTRRKILAGAVVLSAAGRDPAWGERLRALLDSALTSDRDRALFGLGPVSQ